MIHGVRVFPDAYVDSVLQLAATRAMRETEGVDWAAAAMATPGNLATLAEEGFDDLGGAGANDCFLAVRAGSQAETDAALATGEQALSGSAQRGRPAEAGVGRPPRSLDEAATALAGANLALVSVPGDYAALEAHKALSAGLHVLLFSDNVPIDEEVELKVRGEALGLLVMGPGAGTAVLGGAALGFANQVGRGRVGVVAAAGTGAQEVMCLLDRWGAGVSHVIGVGGRDLSATVGGRMARMAVRALARDPETDAVLLVSKPPSAEVAGAVVSEAGGKPLVAALIGLGRPIPLPNGVRLAHTLEGGVAATLDLLGLTPPDAGAGLEEMVAAAGAGLEDGRRLVRGLFSGGTLCYEAMVILSGLVGPVYSNTPLEPGWALPAPPGSHRCLDLGEEEYTRGRPHPMIDPAARLDLIAEEAADPEAGVILLDVVLGHGAHADPAGALAPALAEVAARPGGPRMVAALVGTEADPQRLSAQRKALEEAGCLVAPTAARAALMTAALVSRRPALVGHLP
jgi:FdrA protein